MPLVALLIAACGQAPGVRVGAPWPELRVQTLAGEERVLSGRAEGYRLLNVWAPWCAPCVAEMPSLDRLNAQGPAVIGLAPPDDPYLTDEFMRKYAIGFPTYIDGSGQIEALLAVGEYPTSFLLSPDGRLLARIAGAREWDSPEMRAWLARRMRPDAG